MSVEQPASEERSPRSQPLVFISHRHADRDIADVVREFMRYRSGGDVEVFQTSSADAQAPKIGRNVNREIMKALWKSEVLVLIYTSQDRDWDYCMWECGVATHRESDDTNVIVLQCGRQLPRVFADQVAVDVRDHEKLRRFVNAFLTDPDFFPGREEPVTRFQPNDANVERAARSLFEELPERRSRRRRPRPGRGMARRAVRATRADCEPGAARSPSTTTTIAPGRRPPGCCSTPPS